MRYIFLIMLPLLFVAGCSFNSTETVPQEKNTLLIQAIFNCETAASIIQQSKPLINNIIKQELSLAENFDFDFFLPKELQRITLYYVTDIVAEDQDRLLSAVGEMQPMNPQNVFATAQAELFGDQQDELVVVINDQGKELASLNEKIKDKAHQVNDQYNIEKSADLYNIAKSERFSFMPHMGLGRVRIQSIKNNIKDEPQVDVILQRIKERIKTEVSDFVQKALNSGNAELPFDRIVVFVPKKQTYIKEWSKK